MLTCQSRRPRTIRFLYNRQPLSEYMHTQKLEILSIDRRSIAPSFVRSTSVNDPFFFVDWRVGRDRIAMGFLLTTLIFIAIGVFASLFVRICCNRGPSTNLLHLTLVITATVCCWMMWAIVYLAQLKPLIVPILNESE
ncbi:hypothetical protein Sjap_023026 [Stephania japonica]|uniref:Uncharacterized protein n=1 Tax=Stephania japonica TaxID=461633 RepID=A0AAP0HTP5_9MAGN